MTTQAIEIQGPAPSPAVAAAIAAAIERFDAETAPAPRASLPVVDPWFFAGLMEVTGTDAEDPFTSVEQLETP